MTGMALLKEVKRGLQHPDKIKKRFFRLNFDYQP
jgi:hypothetical protein